MLQYSQKNILCEMQRVKRDDYAKRNALLTINNSRSLTLNNDVKETPTVLLQQEAKSKAIRDDDVTVSDSINHNRAFQVGKR